MNILEIVELGVTSPKPIVSAVDREKKRAVVYDQDGSRMVYKSDVIDKRVELKVRTRMNDR